eukprot:COSAG02_NODE_4130_length_5740_cov_3.273888_7_plen_215_part_00
MEEAAPPLRAELEAMKPSARKKRALAAGATEDELEEAEDADDVIGALASLILSHEKPAGDAGAAELRAELEAMKPSARKKRAVAAGASEEEIDEALDADDPLYALVTLILACGAPSDNGEAKLKAELEAMKPSARKKRAMAAGATADEIDDADDAADPLASLTSLILRRAKTPRLRAHFSAQSAVLSSSSLRSLTDVSIRDLMARMGQKHVMLS